MSRRKPTVSARPVQTIIAGFVAILSFAALCVKQSAMGTDDQLRLVAIILVELGLLELWLQSNGIT